MRPESTKKPYEAPKLSVYGDIREITQQVQPEGMNSDGGGNTNQKTN